MLLGGKSQQKVILIEARCGNNCIHAVQILLLKEVQISCVAVENHHIIKMGGEVVAPVLTLLYYLYRGTEFRKHAGKVKTGFTSADNHYLLKICILALLVNLLGKLLYRLLFADYIDDIFILNGCIAMGNNNLTEAGNGHNKHIGQV